MLHLPVIGITGIPEKGIPRGIRLYQEAVVKAGGTAASVAPGMDIRRLSRDLSGLLIPGGRDLTPSYYGEDTLFEIEPEYRERIDFEFSLMHEIILLKKPLLGICYGMQIINVMLGGSLYQEIGFQLKDALDHTEGSHLIEVDANPYISKGRQTVNSSHHQGVKMLGNGLVCMARAEDGLTEAFFERSSTFLLGVQWHPERMQDLFAEELFRRFVGACLDG